MLSENDARLNLCPECGATVPTGASCQANFQALLALEWDIPGGPGEIPHFFAVATYGIQHPGSMNYTQETVNGLLSAVRDVLDGRASIADIRARVREHAASIGRVTRRDGDTVPFNQVEAWPTVVTDVVAGGVEEYQKRVEQWARSVVETLNSFHA